MTTREELQKKLVDIFGEKRVLCGAETLKPYSSDMTENEAAMPDFAVKPHTVDEIVSLVQLANGTKTPLIPAVARTNLAGLTLANHGGIIVDLREMNKILDVKKDEMYALIEPGVTYAMMKEHLDANFPALRFGYPLSPPNTSIAANCLLDGLANISLKHSSTSNWINGMEAVMPTGEVVKTGSCAVSPYWFSRAPLPDLTGLFISWQGTTGIVTKMAVTLFPNPTHRFRAFLFCYDLPSAFELMTRLSKMDICDDIGGVSWTAGKMLFGVEKPMHREEGEPEFFVYVDISGNSARELRAKKALIEDILHQFKKKNIAIDGMIAVEDITKIDKAFAKFSEFPTYLDFLVDNPGGGLTWIGTYGPISRWTEGAVRGSEMMVKHGFPPTLVCRPMKGGHFVILRLITIFNKSDADEVEKVKKLNAELCDLVLELGFIPYKTPAWVVNKFMERMDKNFYALMKKIKQQLDPNGIMNPGKWLL